MHCTEQEVSIKGIPVRIDSRNGRELKKRCWSNDDRKFDEAKDSRLATSRGGPRRRPDVSDVVVGDSKSTQVWSIKAAPAETL